MKQRAEEFLKKLIDDNHSIYQYEDEEGVYHLESFIVQAMELFAKEEAGLAYYEALNNELTKAEKIAKVQKYLKRFTQKPD